MAAKFTDFVLQLAENPQALAKFQRDPEKAMQEAGLTPAEIALLKSNDAALIRNAIAEDTAGLLQS